jgi:hypothetical protein
MGKVGHQPERNRYTSNFEDLEAFLDYVGDMAHKFQLDYKDVISALHVLELRRANNIAVEDGDFRDEHIAGICEAINNLADRFEQS